MRRSISLLTLILGLATLLFAGQAHARPEILRWTHPNASSLSSFRVLVGRSSGQSDLLDQIVSTASQNSRGVFSVTVHVASGQTIFIRMTAIDAASNESVPSNEIQRSVPLGIPGRPIPVIR